MTWETCPIVLSLSVIKTCEIVIIQNHIFDTIIAACVFSVESLYFLTLWSFQVIDWTVISRIFHFQCLRQQLNSKIAFFFYSVLNHSESLLRSKWSESRNSKLFFEGLGVVSLSSSFNLTENDQIQTDPLISFLSVLTLQRSQSVGSLVRLVSFIKLHWFEI